VIAMRITLSAQVIEPAACKRWGSAGSRGLASGRSAFPPVRSSDFFPSLADCSRSFTALFLGLERGIH
jgi:hypothetical protein